MDSPQIFCANCGAANSEEKAFCWYCKQPLQDQIASEANANSFEPSSSASLLNNRYHILEMIGRGGMGTVFKAEDIRLGGRLVAVKEMRSQSSQTQEEFDRTSQKFEQEAVLLAHLSHPYLPSIYDHFSSDGRWYLVMEYINGETLGQRLHNLGDRLPLAEALNIGINLCIVLGYLHTQIPPIVFGDIKPDNIMLTSENDLLYLIDFGIARLFQSESTNGVTFVSHGYSAPEQHRGGHISPLSDIYSLGATLYQMFAGTHPAKMISDSISAELMVLSGGTELGTLILQMVEDDEQKRWPQDVITVKQRLQHILAQQQKPSDYYQARKQSSWSINTSTPYQEGKQLNKTPASIIPQDIHLSIGSISALAWSPDGSRLAAANRRDVHIYDWPAKERLLASDTKTVTPLITLSINNEYSATNWSYALLAWSPDSTHLAIALEAKLYIQDISKTFLSTNPINLENNINAIDWSPDGKFLVSTHSDNTILVWEISVAKILCTYRLSFSLMLEAIAWSPDSKYLALALQVTDRTIPAAELWSNTSSSIQEVHISSSGSPLRVYEATTGQEALKYDLVDSESDVYSVIWSSDGTNLVSSGRDAVYIWDAKTRRKKHSLEGQIGVGKHLELLDHGRLLALVTEYYEVHLWRTDTWSQVGRFSIAPSYTFTPHFLSTFQSISSKMAVHFMGDLIHVWEIDATQLLAESQKSEGIQYTNAKVVLVGDSGVGKSGLGLVLSQQRFVPTDSTHGRLVWTFDRREDKMEDGRRAIHETLLWDLAGQPGYRLVHQLHLSEVAVALVVFDAHSETDPFAGISHWVRALHIAQRVRGSAGKMKMFLLQARIDRGGKQVSRERINELANKWGFDGCFETSAKEGTNIATLAEAIRDSIDWEQLPKVNSTELFQGIKEFLLMEKKAGRLLSTIDSLYSEFLKMWRRSETTKGFSAEFATGIRLLESAGLIRHLSFGSLVLLQPELLDVYTTALVNAVKDEPDGLGSILEESVRTGSFFIPTDQRIPDNEREKLLLIAMLEDLLSYEIALREQSDEGPYLVFPSESTRENPDLPDPENVSITFTFEGPIRNIYATLAVRLSHSGFFEKKELWKNAITYQAKAGGICGLWLKVIDDGKGELTLFFDTQASEETRFNFEEYIQVHLERKALPESIKRQSIFRCQECGFVATDQLVRKRIERGFNWFNCPVCGTKVSLLDYKERLRSLPKSQVPEMDRAADVTRARAKAQTTVLGKQEVEEFDVFLCYNDKDQKKIIEIGERLKEQGLLPWLDIWEQRPGYSWQSVLEAHIRSIKAAAVFVGKNGVAPWQQQQIQSLLGEFIERQCPVIPLLLAEVSEDDEPELPIFLRNNTWVDFRKLDPDPMEQLIWGITGKRRRG